MGRLDMTDASDRPEKDPKTGRFLPGNSGFGGKPKGARNKLGEAFLEDLLASWEANGPSVITRVIEEKPEQYLKVVASLMPRDLNVNMNQMDDMTDDQLIKRIRTLDAAIRPFIDAEGAGRAVGGTGPAKAH